MSDRLLFFVLLFGFELAISVVATVLDNGVRTMGWSSGIVAITFAMVVTELGRRAGGRVSWPWIAGMLRDYHCCGDHRG